MDPSVHSDPIVHVIDDDPDARDSISALIRSFKLRVEAYKNPEDFLERYVGQLPGCIVSDYRMDALSGLDLQEQLAAREIVTPIIMVTAYASVPVTVQAMQHGAVTLLEKPCGSQELWDAISNALRIDAHRRRKQNRLRELTRRLTSLTPDEQKVLECITDGMANKQIARQHDVSLRTVESRRSNIFKKMKARSLPELVKMVVLAEQEGESNSMLIEANLPR